MDRWTFFGFLFFFFVYRSVRGLWLHGESLAYRALYTHLGICVLAWPTVVCVEKLDHYTGGLVDPLHE